MERAACGLYAILKSIPERFFDRDPHRIAQEYGIPDSSILAFILAEPNGIAGAIMRGDFFYTESGLKCLEINVAGNLGGMEASFWADAYITNPLIRELTASLGLSLEAMKPASRMLEHMVSQAVEKFSPSDGMVNLGILTSEKITPAGLRFATQFANTELTRVLEESGHGLCGRVVVAPPSALREVSGRLTFDGVPVCSVLQLHETVAKPILFRHFKAGRIQVYNTPAAELLSNKITLAILSEHQDSDLLSRDERELLVRHLPWTRRVRPGSTTYQGERVDLPSLLRARRTEMILKPGDGSGGAGVVFGRSSTGEEWGAHIETALAAGRWIAQELLQSRPFLYQVGETGCGVHDVVWGLFGFGTKCGGVFLRMAPKELGGVVNSSHGATESTVLLAG
jgi:hypothetical protein